MPEEAFSLEINCQLVLMILWVSKHLCVGFYFQEMADVLVMTNEPLLPANVEFIFGNLYLMGASCLDANQTICVNQLCVTEIINLLGGKIYFGSWFQRFQSVVGWLPCFCTCGEAIYHGGKCVADQICSTYGGQEAENGKGQGPNILFKSTP
jgi:hypothetical protein